MAEITDDPTNPRLTHGIDAVPVGQAEVYLVLSEGERANGFVRPFRDRYQHVACDRVTVMSKAIAETYARDPTFYGSTFCVHCSKHLPVAEFRWLDGTVVGS